MRNKMLGAICLSIALLVSSQGAFSAECVSDELAIRLESAIGASASIVTGGRHVESQVLGRRMLQLKTDLDPGVPAFVHDKVDPSIKARLANGETNLDLMRAGNAPIGADGRQLNLHHLFGEEPGAMAEIEQSIHSQNHKVLHQMIQTSFRSDEALAASYAKFRSEYWKSRAEDF